MAKWIALDSADGESSTKVHGYIHAMRGPWYLPKTAGNRTLCSNKKGAHNGDRFLTIDEIKGSDLPHGDTCKKCLYIFQIGH